MRYLKRGRRRAVSTALVVIAIGALASPALAHGFGSSATPTHTIADSSIHTWIGIESNSYHNSLMEGVFDGRMTGQVGARTQMSVSKLSAYNTSVDAYWYATAVTSGVADALCMARDYGANPKCYRTRIRFEEQWLVGQKP